MTIHRAKGLEFDVVCVADLGRGPRWRAELMRVGRDGRFGLRLAEPGTGRRESALDYKALGEERVATESREERRLFYVAMTRARERLILSGAAKLDAWPALENGGGGGPIAWIGPAVDPLDGVGVTFVRPEDVPTVPPVASAPPVGHRAAGRHRATSRPSATGRHRATGERAQLLLACRVPPLRLPVLRRARPTAATAPGASPRRRAGRHQRARSARSIAARSSTRCSSGSTSAGRSPDRSDDRRGVPALGCAPRRQAEDAAQVAALVERFAAGEVCGRLARATAVRREARFRFLLGGAGAGAVLIGGVFDVIAREPAGRTLVVDYKTDRLEGADPQSLADRAYGTQRLVYALAALRAGATEVEVIHTFLERPQRPAVATFTRDQAPALEERLAALARGILERDFRVTDVPHRALCDGCPAEGGLCSWPLEMTRREAADTLF